MHGDVPTLTRFHATKFQAYTIFKKIKKNEIISVPDFPFARMRAQLNEGGGRILLSDNIGGRSVTMPPIRLQCTAV